MTISKTNLIIGLAASGAFAAATQFLTVKQVPAPTIAQCEAASEATYINYSRATRGNPTDEQRRDYLHSNAMRTDCIQKARSGSSLILAVK